MSGACCHKPPASQLPEEAVVPYTTPYYSISPEDPEVYHDKSNCPDGERIKPENKRLGTDDRQKCKQCPNVH
jgi:hypothetical protein